MPADIVHEDNSALARVARKTTPAAAVGSENSTHWIRDRWRIRT
jgi:hypothetical protein